MSSYAGRRGPPKTTPSGVLCQKCLKRGHYSYECKVTIQDRPYKTRPSRSQQLRNPKLAPKLHEDTFNALQLKKGVADQELAKREAERAKNHKREGDEGSKGGEAKRRRRRSVSRSDSGSRSGSSSYSDSNSDSGSSAASRQDVPSRRPKELTAPPPRQDGHSASPTSRSPSPYSTASDRHSSPRRRNDSRRSPVADSAGPQIRGSPEARIQQPPPHSRHADPHKARLISSDFFDRAEVVDDSYGDRHPRRRDSRSPDRPQSGRESGSSTRQNYRQRDDAKDGERHNAPEKQRSPVRERSLSPFSKRLALTRGVKPGR